MLPARYIESNTGEVQDREILPKGVEDFPILYFFQCLILFLTKHICFVYIPSYYSMRMNMYVWAG